MADLDDFFAKKDRKKAKGKKFTTTDEIAKKLEETGKRVEKIKIKDRPINPESDEIQQIQDDDEWKEFEEEKKDYTGLKIGNLTVEESLDVESDEEQVARENNSDGESGDGNIKRSGPWNKPEIPVQEPEVAPPVITNPGVGMVTGSYVPPHLRGQHSTPSTLRNRSKNLAPDIHSEEYFPTLSAMQQPNDAGIPGGRRKKDEGIFEEVRNKGGSRSHSTQESQAQAPKLSLGNKYGALSHDQS